LAIEPIRYLTYAEAVTLHIMLMRRLGETHFGVLDRALIESALARPRQAATFEDADLIRQAATLGLGLIKNDPWAGGNKRTATILSTASFTAMAWRCKRQLVRLWKWRLPLKRTDGALTKSPSGIVSDRSP
jgi:Fic/DOC family protein